MRGAAAIVALAMVVTGAAGCGKKDRSPGAKLELADARIVIEQTDGVTHVLALKADGAVTFDNEAVVTLRKDGQIAVGGKLSARLDPKFHLYAHGLETNVVVTREPPVFQMDGGDELQIEDSGAVTGPLFETMDHPRLMVDGARVRYEGPPGARQATLLGFAAFVTGLNAVPKPH